MDNPCPIVRKKMIIGEQRLPNKYFRKIFNAAHCLNWSISYKDTYLIYIIQTNYFLKSYIS